MNSSFLLPPILLLRSSCKWRTQGQISIERKYECQHWLVASSLCLIGWVRNECHVLLLECDWGRSYLIEGEVVFGITKSCPWSTSKGSTYLPWVGLVPFKVWLWLHGSLKCLSSIVIVVRQRALIPYEREKGCLLQWRKKEKEKKDKADEKRAGARVC